MQTQERSPIYTSAVLSGPICGMGVGWDKVLTRVGINPTQRNDRAFLVSAGQYLTLWTAIPMLFALSTAPDFETGITRMSQFKSLFGPMQFILSQSPSAFDARVAPDVATAPLPGSFSSPHIVYLHGQANTLARHAIRPLRVCLPWPLDAHAGLADIFGQVPEHGEATLTYARADARVPFISDNPELWEATKADLRSQAMILSKGMPRADRVRATMLEAFSITDPTIAHVCGRLKLSRSTLARRLEGEGTSFQPLLDETRKELALRYLLKSGLNKQKVAHLVGYRDPNAFQRAFRK